MPGDLASDDAAFSSLYIIHFLLAYRKHAVTVSPPLLAMIRLGPSPSYQGPILLQSQFQTFQVNCPYTFQSLVRIAKALGILGA
jgi:hypothetical protein